MAIAGEQDDAAGARGSGAAQPRRSNSASRAYSACCGSCGCSAYSSSAAASARYRSASRPWLAQALLTGDRRLQVVAKAMIESLDMLGMLVFLLVLSTILFTVRRGRRYCY